MQLGSRDVGRVARSLLQRQHYVAALNMLALYEKPVEMFRRYLTAWGTYPTQARVRTPVGPITLGLHTRDDILTVNEIFCRQDYRADAGDKVFVDFGSNIGISAAYFLTRSPDVYGYLFEPLPMNIGRLKINLAPFKGRFTLAETAVGLVDGIVEFGWEATGRYGGVGRDFGNKLAVPCRDSNDVLEGILKRHGRIDILKIDIETMERELTERIPADMARRIGKIYVEFPISRNPFPDLFKLRQYGSIAQFVRVPT